MFTIIEEIKRKSRNTNKRMTHYGGKWVNPSCGKSSSLSKLSLFLVKNKYSYKYKKYKGNFL